VGVAASRPEFRHGRIVIAQLLGRNGKREEHPALIISPYDEIIQPEQFDPRLGGGKVAANLVAAMGVSTKYRQFSDPYVTLPVGAQTQITKDSAAILNWYAVLDIPDDCEYLLGDVPPRLMRQINDAYRAHIRGELGAMQGTLVYLLDLLSRR
jgi:hypothetical protein